MNVLDEAVLQALNFMLIGAPDAYRDEPFESRREDALTLIDALYRIDPMNAQYQIRLARTTRRQIHSFWIENPDMRHQIKFS